MDNLKGRVSTELVRRYAELFFERPGECLVRVVTGLKCYIENATRLYSKSFCGLAETSGTDIPHDRASRIGAERPDKMELGQPACLSHIRKRYLVAKVQFYISDCSTDWVHHSLSQATDIVQEVKSEFLTGIAVGPFRRNH